MGKQDLNAGAYVAQALDAFDEAMGHMEIEVAESGRRLVREWLCFLASWKGRRVSGFEDPRDLAVKLLADSFAVAMVRDLCLGGKAVDIGSGNGWPGLALSALGRCAHVSLLDSREGACDFLRGFLRAGGISRVDVVHARAEAAGQDPRFREGYSLAVSRAVATPGILLELCSGLVSVGGKTVLWIGPGQEVPRSGPGLAALGMEGEAEIKYALPWGMGDRVLAVYRKVRALEARYPRRYPAIRRKPLL